MSKTAQAKENAIISKEKEQIAIAWNSLIIDKTIENSKDYIDTINFQKELTNSGNNVLVHDSENNNFLVRFINTNHEYIIDKNGIITFNDKNTIPPSDSVIASSIMSWTSTSDTDFHNDAIKNIVTEIEFVDLNSVNAPKINGTSSWDVSQNKDESIIAWLNGTKLYIGGKNGVKANEDSSYIFFNFPKLTSINFNNKFNTSSVTNMACMFAMSSKINSLNLNSFDTSSVTNMNGMFGGYIPSNTNGTGSKPISDNTRVKMELTNVEFNNFNTSKVTSMYGMFWNCTNMLNIDLSHFNTSNVTDMSYMFTSSGSIEYYSKFEEIKFGDNWNTTNLTNMTGMFCFCKNLKSLDLSSFDTSNVTDMNYLFQDCSSLRTIYVGDYWNTNKVKKADSLFLNCKSLIGGNGTKYSTNHGITYAKIDTSSQSGFLTDKKQNLEINNTKISYIESTGKQYIDTGIPANNNIGFDITFMTKNTFTTTSNRFGCIFGSRTSSNVNELQLNTYTPSGYTNGNFKYGTDTRYSAYLKSNDIVNVKYNNKNYYVDDTQKLTLNVEDFSIDYRIYIFALNNGGSATEYGKLRLYNFKIYDSGILVRNFVPVYNQITKSYGLYDEKNNVFYGNSGTNEFTVES